MRTVPASSSREVTEDVTLLYLGGPVLLDVLVVRVVGVLTPPGFDRAHQNRYDDEGEHPNHHCQIQDDISEVLLSQSFVHRVARSRGIILPVVQVTAQSTGQRPLQVTGEVGPIRYTHLVESVQQGTFFLPFVIRISLLLKEKKVSIAII